MTDEAFSKLVSEGIDALPDRILKTMQNVAIVIADKPSATQRKKNHLKPNQDLLGLYEGIPLTARGLWYDAVLPDKITIFKEPLLRLYSDPEDIKTSVYNTVWHEVAHHFGMDERHVRDEEKKRHKRL